MNRGKHVLAALATAAFDSDDAVILETGDDVQARNGRSHQALERTLGALS